MLANLLMCMVELIGFTDTINIQRCIARKRN